MTKFDRLADRIDGVLYEPNTREHYSKEDIDKLKHTGKDTNILLLIGLALYIPIAFIFRLVDLNK